MKFFVHKNDLAAAASKLSGKLALSSKQIIVYFNAALAGKAGLEMDRYLRDVFENSSTIYDRAMDAGRNVFAEYGPDHRLFDGGHTVAGAWEAVRNALPDDRLNEEALGFLAAYWKDLVTPMGMPIANFSRDSFDQVTAAASRIGIEPEWLKDLVSFTATEGAGALAAVVGAALSWHKNDIEDFAEYAASIAAGSLLAANPLSLTIAILLLARSWHVGRRHTTTERILGRFGWGSAKAGAFIGAASLASGAWLGVAAGLTAAVVVSHFQKRVGSSEEAYNCEHMADQMQSLIDRKVVPLLEPPK